MNSKACVVQFLMVAACCLVPVESRAMCCPFPPDDRWILSASQLNFVVLDREQGEIRLVPNIRIQGNGEDFALVVPTPTLPELGSVDRGLWDSAAILTSPARRAQGTGGGCSSPLVVQSESPVDFGADDGVVIHGEQTIGGFVATIVSSEEPAALVDWLNDHGFDISSDQVDRFAPYVERGWFFTAMKQDPLGEPVELPLGGWDADVHPVVFTYKARELEVPLPIMSVNMAPNMRVTYYVVDDRRVTLPRFETAYVNRISRTEMGAIVDSHPALEPFLETGKFLTRLDGSYDAPAQMAESSFLLDAPTNDEFRRIAAASPAVPIEFALVGIPMVAFRLRSRRRKRTCRG